MIVKVHNQQSSEPVVYENALGCFQKGDMFCVFFEKDGKKLTHKYPMIHIFRVENDYN